MSLNCGICRNLLACISQLAFRQSALNREYTEKNEKSARSSNSENSTMLTDEWILTLKAPTNEIDWTMPRTTIAFDNPDTELKTPEALCNVVCDRCKYPVGVVGILQGFSGDFLKFHVARVVLFASGCNVPQNSLDDTEWLELVVMNTPGVPWILPEIQPIPMPLQQDRIGEINHFKSQNIMHELIEITKMINMQASPGRNITPSDAQWRAFFFASLYDTLMVQPAGHDVYRVEEMLMTVYKKINEHLKIVSVAPNSKKFNLHAYNIAKNTGLKVQKLTNIHDVLNPSADVYLTTPRTFASNIEFSAIHGAQISLLILDGVFEKAAEYEMLLSKLGFHSHVDRARILAITTPRKMPGGPAECAKLISSICKSSWLRPYWLDCAGKKLVNYERSTEKVVKNLMHKRQTNLNGKYKKIIDDFLNRGKNVAEVIQDQDEPMRAEKSIEIEACGSVEVERFDNDPKFFGSSQLDFFNFNKANDIKKILNKINADKAFRVRFTEHEKQITAQFLKISETTNVAEDLFTSFLMTIHKNTMQTGVTSWIKLHEQISTSPEKMTVEFDKLTSFYFDDAHNVTFEKQIWSGKMTLNLNSRHLSIKFKDEEFLIDKFNIDSHILINQTSRGFDLFLCLKYPPKYFKDAGVRHAFNFNERSFNLCLKSTSLCESMSQLRSALSQSTAEIDYIFNATEKYFTMNKSKEQKIDDFDKECAVKHWTSKHAAVLPPRLPDSVINQLQAVESVELLQLILMNTKPERFEELKFAEIDQTHPCYVSNENVQEVISDYVKLATVTVTPSRIIYGAMSLVSQNRVIRYYPDRKNFLLVNFSSDYDDGNPWNMDEIRDHFRSIMIEGIKLAGSTYRFLGCSNSQLREGRCWFTFLDREMIYKRIGDLTKFNNGGRKVTRAALAFAASNETVAVSYIHYLKDVEDDVMGGENNEICFSDGIGRGSRELFEEIAQKLNLPTIPSALQIRVGGIKGVIGISDQPELLTIRKSMKKFESTHNIIEVLKISEPAPVYLDRKVILMLRHFGVPEEVFLNMQEINISTCLNALAAKNPKDTINFVKTKAPVAVIEWQKYDTKNLLSEPFFKKILLNQVVDSISVMASHTKLAVNKGGRVLMGVLDDSDVLNYGEVYAHVIDESDEMDKVLDGKVVVFRNPCVLPSDIRILRARSDVPEKFKELYKNVLVFPAKGPNSHARECAGGDLDGDVFSIIWDEKLIPPNMEVPGRQVIEVETKDNYPPHWKQKPSGNVTELDMINFFCNFQHQNRLGMISNAHLAAADRYGVESEQALTLARNVVVETDAPIKGMTVGLSYKKFMPEIYPHYMAGNKVTYHSTTIVGKLFDEVDFLAEIVREHVKSSNSTETVKSESWESQNEVEKHYSAYTNDIIRLLQSFDLAREVDLFSGCPMWKKGRHSDFKRRVQKQKILDDAMKAFWKKWQGIFKSFLEKNNNHQDKINEWYNQPKFDMYPALSFSLLALEYVIKFDDATADGIVESIRSSTQDWISYNKINWIENWKNQFAIEKEMRSKLGTIEFGISGVSFLGLNEEFSKLQFCTDGDLNKIEQKLRCLIDNEKNSKRQKCYAQLRLTINSQTILISNCQDEILYSNSILRFFNKNKHYWQALRVLFEWARAVGVVESNGLEGLMTSTSFILLFIEYASKNPIEIVHDFQKSSISRISRWMDWQKTKDYDDALIVIHLVHSSNLIFDFLQMLSCKGNFEIIASKADPIQGRNLIEREKVEELQKNAEFSLFVLTVNGGDINKMFEYTSKQRVFRISKELLNIRNFKNENLKKQIERDILMRSKLTNSYPAVELKLITQGNQCLLNVSSKNHRDFKKIEHALDRIHGRLKRGNNKLSTRSALIIPEYSQGLFTKLMFAPYTGDNYHLNDTDSIRTVAAIPEKESDSLEFNFNWADSEYHRYHQEFMAQYSQQQNKSDSVEFKKQLKCIIALGTNYFISTPDSFLIKGETLESIQKIINFNRYSGNDENDRNFINTSGGETSLFKSPSSAEPLKLAPIGHRKTSERFRESRKRKRDEYEKEEIAKPNDNIDKIRQVFFKSTNICAETFKKFASDNGFTKSALASTKVVIHAVWKGRSLRVITNSDGIVEEIQCQPIRLFSATFMRHKKSDSDSDDVRVCLDTEKIVDRDENLNALRTFLDKKPILTSKFVEQISRHSVSSAELDAEPFLKFTANIDWKLQSIRVEKSLKFMNGSDDVLENNEIYESTFESDKTTDWLDERYEILMRLNTDKCELSLCRSSYAMSLKLFEFTRSI